MVTPLNERPQSGPYSGINARSAKRFLTEQFKQVGLSFAEDDARDLVMAITGFDLTDFITRGTEFLTPEQFDRVKLYADRRLAGEPVDSILGRREFFGREFIISKDVLSPRGDTEVLVNCALKSLQDITHPSILDLGTGSGAIIITLLAELSGTRGCAVDISEEALAIALSNAKKHAVDDRLKLLRSEWYASVKKQYNLIVSNPPYITNKAMEGLEKEVLDYDPDIALRGGEEGLDAYHIIIGQAPNHLKPNGWLWVEIGFDQGPAVKSLFEACGFESVSVVKDLSNNDRSVGGQIHGSHATEKLT